MSYPPVSSAHRWRWLVMGVFVISSALNYLDRQILAQLAPILKTDLHITDQQYGWLLSAFAAFYAVSAPCAGWVLDRLGLTRGMSAAVGFWSLAGMATGLTSGFWSLAACRSALAVGESAGVPGSAKAGRLYLPAPEYALGSAAGQVGLTVGGVVAPPLATWFALQGQWRATFLVAGALGLLWIPLWRMV
ncbi:MAG: MFS transporter, partial [Bryobacterales bacterium]|nr:MFS transporter [Bryobacterales bacterium]